MSHSDFLIIGGGVAGLSAGAALARHGRVTVLEAEEAIGYHSSGRSVSFSHYGIGNAVIRGLTAHSRAFYEGEGAALARPSPSLYFAEGEALPALASLRDAMTPFTDAIRDIGPDDIARLCPILRTGAGGAVSAVLDPTGLKLDADALLQFYARAIRGADGAILVGRRVSALEHVGGGWRATTQAGEIFSAPVVINAAGSWADRVATLAGLAPLGLEPKRRTVIAADPPEGVDIAAWPFVHSVAGDFYMLPEAGRLLVSPVDEIEDEPGDAQVDEYQVALAADRLEHYTTLSVRRIAHRWAGLRTFAPDRTLVAGFGPPGFFWLAGQGGYGLQTAPAMAEAVAALITGAPWPAGLAEAGVTAADLDPARF